MSHLESMVSWFKKNNGYATLHQILTSGESWAHEFNARKTNLHQNTIYKLVLTKGKRPSDNLYTLTLQRPPVSAQEPDAQSEVVKV